MDAMFSGLCRSTIALLAMVLAVSAGTASAKEAGGGKKAVATMKIQSLYESRTAFQTAKKRGVAQKDPDPNLDRHQFRCKHESDWPYACTLIIPGEIYPQASTTDYAYGIYTEFDGETQYYQMSYTKADGTIEDSVNFSLNPQQCGSGGYSYFLNLQQPNNCTWGGVSIAFLYPHPHGRLTAKVTAGGANVFYQLLDIIPLIITKTGGDSQVGLISSKLPAPIRMRMRDFEGNIPKYPVRTDTSIYTTTTYTVTGPGSASGMSATGSSVSATGEMTAEVLLGNRTGQYKIVATHTDSASLAEPFTATAVDRAEPDDNKDDEEGNGEDCSVADPISIGIGNSFQREDDYVRTGLSTMEFVRYYNALGSKSKLMRNFWTTNFDLAVLTPAIAGQPYRVRRPDGRVIPFVLQNGQYNSMRPYFHGVLRANGSGWQYVTEDGTTESYDSMGRWTTTVDLTGRTLTATYNSKGLLTKVVANTGESLTFAYNSYSQVISATDHSGRAWTYTYNGFSNLTQVQDPDGLYHIYHYESPYSPYLLTGISVGRSTIANGNPRYVTWEFDEKHRAVSNYFGNGLRRFSIAYNDITGERTVTDPNGNESLFSTHTQSGRGFVDSVKGPGYASCGLADTEFERDLSMNVVKKTAFGRAMRFGNYDSKGQAGFQIEAADIPSARRKDYVFDSRFIGKPTKITEASVASGGSKVTQLAYDPAGNITQRIISGFRPDGTPVSSGETLQYGGPLAQISQIDGPRTNVADITRFEYDLTTKRLKAVIDPNGIRRRDNITYTSTGQIATEDRPNGLHVAYTYYAGSDLPKSLTETGSSGARTTTWVYDDLQRVTSINFSDGLNTDLTTIFTYDMAGGLIWIQSPGAGAIRYTLDMAGNRIKEQHYTGSPSAETRWVSRTFDAYNRVRELINPGGTSVTDTHPDGRVMSYTDGRSNVTTYGYDDFLRMTEIIKPAQNAITYAYDAGDRLVRITDANQATTTYAYDDLGNKLEQNSPDTGRTVFSYDEKGNVVSALDALGQQTSYVYDAGDRLKEIHRADPADGEAYAYDACLNGMGKLCSMTNGVGDFVNYEYDAFGRVARQTTNAGSIAYRYNATDDVAEITYPSGRSIRYSYNGGRQTTSVVAVDGGNPYAIARSIEHMSFGPAKSWIYGNGLTETRQYDLQYRATSIASGSKSTINYGAYDSDSNLLQRTVNGDAQTFEYDSLSRLKTATGWFGPKSYSYDQASNRSSLTQASGTTLYAYASQSNRMTSDSQWTYGRDLNGNETSKAAGNGAGWDLTYTSDNRLLSVTDKQNPATLLGAYRYNALGQRTVKATAYGDKRFIFGLNNELLVELLPDGSVLQEYVYLDGAPIAMLGVPATPATSFNVDQIIDNPASDPNCSKKSSSIAVNGSYLTCPVSSATSFGLYWPWTPPVTGDYDVYVMWAWSGDYQCYRFTPGTQESCIGGATTPGTWLSFGRRHLPAGFSNPSLDTNSNMHTSTMRMDAVRYVLASKDATDRDYIYLHTDAMGTPIRATNRDTTIVWDAKYDPFGRALVNDDPDGNGAHQDLNLRFPGQYFDRETALHYNMFRVYDPDRGRYLESDPIGLYGGLNTYIYVDNNPIGLIDASGHQARPVVRPPSNPWNAFQARNSGRFTRDEMRDKYRQSQLDAVGRNKDFEDALNEFPDPIPVPGKSVKCDFMGRCSVEVFICTCKPDMQCPIYPQAKLPPYLDPNCSCQKRYMPI